MTIPNVKWQDTLPENDGWYWFFGELWMGEMGRDYHDDYTPEPELSLVNIEHNIIAAQGHFVGSNKFNKEKRRAGWLGYWAKATLPEPPYDGNQLFNTV